MSIFIATVSPAHRLLVACLQDEEVAKVGIFLVNEIAKFKQDIADRAAFERDLRELDQVALDERNELVREALKGIVSEDELLDSELETEEQLLANMAEVTKADHRRIAILAVVLSHLTKGRYASVLKYFNARLARMDAMGKLLTAELPAGAIAPSTRERVAGHRRQILECVTALKSKLG